MFGPVGFLDAGFVHRLGSFSGWIFQLPDSKGLGKIVIYHPRLGGGVEMEVEVEGEYSISANLDLPIVSRRWFGRLAR